MTLAIFSKRDKNSIYHGEAYFRPLVKVHPETGRKSLFIGRHAFGIPGMVRDESRDLLKTLLQAIVSDESASTPIAGASGTCLFGIIAVCCIARDHTITPKLGF